MKLTTNHEEAQAVEKQASGANTHHRDGVVHLVVMFYVQQSLQRLDDQREAERCKEHTAYQHH